MTLFRLLDFYRLFYVGFIIVASMQTAISTHPHPDHGGMHMAVLGTVEVAAAALLLFRRTRKIAAGALTLIFALALSIAVAMGEEWPLRMFFYAGTAIFIAFLDRFRPQQG